MKTKDSGTSRSKAQHNGASNGASKAKESATGAAAKSEREQKKERLAKANALLVRALEMSYWKEESPSENDRPCRK